MNLTVPKAFELAVQHHQAGRLAEAEALYRQILAAQPSHAEAWHHLGLIAHQACNHDLAIKWINQAIALNPNNAHAYSNLGEAYRVTGRLADAVACFHRALEIDSSLPAVHHNLGNTLRDAGQLDEAVASLRRALELQPHEAEAHNNLGLALRCQGRLVEAATSYRQALAIKPDNLLAQNNLGIVLFEQGRFEEAAAAYRRALALRPDYAEAHNNLGNALWKLGQLDEAISAYRQAIAFKANYAEAYNNLGNALRDRGRLNEATVACRRAIELSPNLPGAHNNLGNALRDLDQPREAVAAYRRAIELQPGYAEAHNNLGNTLRDLGLLDEAIAEGRRAIELKPSYAEAQNNLGNALRDQGLLEEAEAAYRRAIELDPETPDAHNNLGIVLAGLGRLEEAIAEYRHALQIRPDYAEAQSNLGGAFKDQGRLDDALAAFRRAFELAPPLTDTDHQPLRTKPARSWFHSNLVYTAYFHPDYDAGALAREHQFWSKEYAAPLASQRHVHTPPCDPERRLRVGYVSPNFWGQAESFFVLPLLEAHDHQQLEVHAYADVARRDRLTERFRSSVDHWHEVQELTDAALAESIQKDGIDVLVDLTMHMAHNRLLTFARQPAPVQVTWLAYPGSTGLETIGYRLTDAFMDPPGETQTYSSEEPVRLPDSWCCYDPLDVESVPGPSPATQGAPFTFGSLNNFCKHNERVLSLWARVLAAVEGSRLLMLAGLGRHREQVREFFRGQGIAPDRIEFAASMPRKQYLREYSRIDVALDPFPYNGITTTCDALWMGVPVLTLVGQMAPARAGLSLLHAVGLPELAAQSEEEYVRIAGELAGNLARLAELRATLRPRMAASPLMDAPRFARNIEAAYRAMWRQWCQKEPAR